VAFDEPNAFDDRPGIVVAQSVEAVELGGDIAGRVRRHWFFGGYAFYR
jgi:hypothetical protein